MLKLDIYGSSNVRLRQFFLFVRFLEISFQIARQWWIEVHDPAKKEESKIMTQAFSFDLSLKAFA